MYKVSVSRVIPVHMILSVSRYIPIENIQSVVIFQYKISSQ
jgi:hypothetical protein